jgi:hypothetical protein
VGRLTLFAAPAGLDCGHAQIWVGQVQEHMLPMECTTCTPEEEAISELEQFASLLNAANDTERLLEGGIVSSALYV